MMKFYNFLLKSPALFAIIAILAMVFCNNQVFGFITAIGLITILYVVKNKNIMSQIFNLKMALYINIFYILVSLNKISFTTLKNIAILFIFIYVLLLIFNGIGILLVKISERKDWLRYLTAPIVFILERPQYFITLLILIFSFQFMFSYISHAKGKFVKFDEIGTIENDILDIIPLKNDKLFVLKRNQVGNGNGFFTYDIKSHKRISSGFLETQYLYLEEPKAIPLSNGDVFVFGLGGRNYGEIFNPTTGKSTFVTDDSDTQNNIHNAIELKDGRIFILNRIHQNNKFNFEYIIYDIKKQKIVTKENLFPGIGCRDLLLLKDGKVFMQISEDQIPSCYLIFNPQNYSIEMISLPKTLDILKKQFLLSNGEILIVNYIRDENKTNFIYFNPDTKKIKIKQADFLSGIEDFDIAQLKNDSFLITGGKKYRENERRYDFLSSVGIYDAKSSKYFPLHNKMNFARALHNTIRLNDGKILIIQGENTPYYENYNPVVHAELFVP